MRANFESRFWSKVAMSDDESCWPWTAYKNHAGYGKFFTYKHADPPEWMAHRVAFALTFGMFDISKDCLHRCDHPPCCNPRHLFLGTDLENARDKADKGRSLRGDRHPFSVLSEDLVRKLRNEHPSGWKLTHIAKSLGVSRKTVYAAVNGKTWKHVK